MKKTLLCLFIFFLIPAAPALAAENYQVTSYYPAPIAKLSTLRLFPQSAFPSTNCPLGTIYANADDNGELYYCVSSSPSPIYLPIAGTWTLNSNNLYLTDTTNPQDKKIAIGTETPAFKLTLTEDGGIYSDDVTASFTALSVTGADALLVWLPSKGSFHAGHFPSKLWNDSDIGIAATVMGFENTSQSNNSIVWGGRGNFIGLLATSGGINGGKDNNLPSVAGSEKNQILGGQDNIAAGKSSTVGGKNNNIPGPYDIDTIGGGLENKTGASGHSHSASIIAGGYQNTVEDDAGYSTISGGGNWLGAGAPTASPGPNTITSGNTYATISGGMNNTINGSSGDVYSTISGGYNNSLSGLSSIIGGGEENTITRSMNSTISGGQLNAITADLNSATIVGGLSNTVTASHASILGGGYNIASADATSVLGGWTNTTSGINSIAGGNFSTAAGDYSLAAGQYMALTAAGDHSFVWGYSGSAIAPVTSANTFLIYSAKMGIRKADPNAFLEINGNSTTDDYFAATSTSAATTGNIFIIKNTTGYIGVGKANPSAPLEFANGAYVSTTGNFVNASSRAYKEKIADLPLTNAMNAFLKLTPVRYNYKNEKNEEYLGFIAEDVPDLVADKNRQGLSPMDLAAVLTKVVAHQQDVLEQQQRDTKSLTQEIDRLKQKIK